MDRTCLPTAPFDDQTPGTSGLRKKTRHFMQPNYLENFVQATFNAIGGGCGKTLVVGGDGRYFNAEAIQKIIQIAAGNGVAKLIIGQDGILSTPAASNLIRKMGADGGFILSASHNPAGLDADFGVKFNAANGGPAPQALGDKIGAETKSIQEIRVILGSPVDLSQPVELDFAQMQISIIDPVTDYLDLMEGLFDFDRISALFASGFSICFDAMHAVTGPYARAIFEDRLGAARGSVINGDPKTDFGGGHPDPNPVWAKGLIDLMHGADAPDIGVASDGDGDRNMIVGRGIYVTPSDSLAVLAANAHLAPGYARGLAGIARSMPTSGACDRVAVKLGITSYETPTGWKFFGNLLDAGRATLCGEESAGTGSDHIREKDGIWAILLWLNILAVRQQSVAEILTDHWREFGRNYYARLDFEAVDATRAQQMMETLKRMVARGAPSRFGGLTMLSGDNFSYDDPVDGSKCDNQGIRLFFEDGARAVFRLSGTGTDGATVRLYLEQYVDPTGALDMTPQHALARLQKAAFAACDLQNALGRQGPDVVT